MSLALKNTHVMEGKCNALEITIRLGLESSDGMVRVGQVPLSLGLQHG
jgi:hypothetical protein